jgi:hypothetical protein
MITHFVEFCRERIFFKILCNHSAQRIFAKPHDTDLSEQLSDFIIKNLPEGSELFGADKQEIQVNKK